MKKKWTVYCDGGARGNPGPAAAAFVVEEGGRAIHKEAKFLGEATNNVAEYKGVILALKWISQRKKEMPEKIQFVLDSELVTKQLSGKYKIKNENLRNLYFSAKELENKIPSKVFYLNVERERNRLSDFLVNKKLDEKR